jgi:hypothetical protein
MARLSGAGGNWQVIDEIANKAVNYLKVTPTVRQGFKPLPQS